MRCDYSQRPLLCFEAEVKYQHALDRTRLSVPILDFEGEYSFGLHL